MKISKYTFWGLLFIISSLTWVYYTGTNETVKTETMNLLGSGSKEILWIQLLICILGIMLLLFRIGNVNWAIKHEMVRNTNLVRDFRASIGFPPLNFDVNQDQERILFIQEVEQLKEIANLVRTAGIGFDQKVGDLICKIIGELEDINITNILVSKDNNNVGINEHNKYALTTIDSLFDILVKPFVTVVKKYAYSNPQGRIDVKEKTIEILEVLKKMCCEIKATLSNFGLNIIVINARVEKTIESYKVSIESYNSQLFPPMVKDSTEIIK